MDKCLLWSLAVGLVAVVGCNSSTAPSGGAAGSHAAHAAYMPEGAVLPNDETIESNEYKPLSRPLFLYVRTESLKKPVAAAFLTYLYSDEGQELVAETGYVKLPAAEIQSIRKQLQEAIQAAGGTAPDGPLKGEIIIDGSSTVAPISAAASEEFSKLHPEARVPVGTSGTGGGFKKFIEGVTDINDASRPIKDSEVEQLQAGGKDFLELKIAIDGLTVVVNSENDWVDGMTVEQLRKIWEPGSTVTKWSEVMPEWPDEEIVLFGPDTDSGTFDYFTEEICGEGGASRSDYQQNTDDNFLVTGVAGDRYALGYFGYAYYIENKNKLKALAIAPATE